MPVVNSDLFEFHPLAEPDLPLLHRWLNAPHILEWWNQPGPTLEEVMEKYLPRVRGETDVSAYIMLRNGEAVGYVQTYPVQDGAWGLRITTVAIGLDMFIGEPECLHRGLGSTLLLQFLKDVVFSNDEIAHCFADPVCRNSAAVRAFAKAGFRHLKTVLSPETPDLVCLMCATRSDYKEGTA